MFESVKTIGMDQEDKNPDLLSLTTDIVSAFAGHHTVAVGELPGLIASVFTALRTASQGEATKAEAPPTPAVPIRKLVTAEFLICLEDGKKLRMLKRHLQTRYHMTPEEHRKRWGLPQDYPMVAPAYAELRSTMARQFGLGRKPAALAEPEPVSRPEPAPVSEPAPAPAQQRRTGGRRKAAA